jgi:hypothetical protein
MIQNKRGVIGMIMFFVILFMMLIIGFIAAVALGVIDYASDEITPIMRQVGVDSGDANLSSAMNYSFNTTNTIVQSMPWVIGFAYVMALLFSIIFVVVYRENPHPALMGFYLLLVFLLILGTVILSNMYQDIYSGNDEIGLRLQAQTLMSYMILYSPMIMTLIAFIAGVIMFSGSNEGSGGI